MPRMIKQCEIVEVDDQEILPLERWLAEENHALAVQLQPGEAPLPLFAHLDSIPLIAIHFPAFMDGRGFSYARELRERGFSGELRATGAFIRDQLTYMTRCGFDAFQMDDETLLEEALSSLADFSESYQASADQPLPLFRRRA